MERESPKILEPTYSSFESDAGDDIALNSIHDATLTSQDTSKRMKNDNSQQDLK